MEDFSGLTGWIGPAAVGIFFGGGLFSGTSFHSKVPRVNDKHPIEPLVACCYTLFTKLGIGLRVKLKLEIAGDVTVLSITEAIEPPHVPVLKAGINKLVQSDKKVLLLDLSGLKDGDIQAMSVFQEIAKLQTWAQEMGAQLVIASTMPGLGQATSRDEGMRILGSVLSRLLAKEAYLRAQLTRLQRQKADYEEKLNTAASSGALDVKSLRREGSDLKSMIGTLEHQIGLLLKERLEPFASEPMKAKLEALNRILTAVLEQEGVLPVT